MQANAILTPQFSTDEPSELGSAAADVSSASLGLGLDFGFRVFTIADTNDLGVNMPVSDYSQDMLQQLERSLRPERRGEELLFGCVLAYGLPLTWECKSEQIAGCTLLSYGDNALVACFDSEINRELILEIARREPLRVVFADQSFESSMEKVNLIEQLMTLCPSLKDEIKVI